MRRPRARRAGPSTNAGRGRVTDQLADRVRVRRDDQRIRDRDDAIQGLLERCRRERIARNHDGEDARRDLREGKIVHWRRGTAEALALVADDADDRDDRRARTVPARHAQARPDGITVLQVSPDERAVDDRDALRCGGIALREGAAAQRGQPENPKYDGVTPFRCASGSSPVGYVLPTIPTVNVTLISESGYDTERAAS